MTRAEAIKLCEVFGVNYSEHPNIVVTENGNVYTNGVIDPADKGERFELNKEEIETPKKGKK